jgi:hypothetical protein
MFLLFSLRFCESLGVYGSDTLNTIQFNAGISDWVLMIMQ